MTAPVVKINPFFAIGYTDAGRYRLDGPSLEHLAGLVIAADDADLWELTDTGWVQLAKDDPRLVAAIKAERTKLVDRVAPGPRWRVCYDGPTDYDFVNAEPEPVYLWSGTNEADADAVIAQVPAVLNPRKEYR